MAEEIKIPFSSRPSFECAAILLSSLVHHSTPHYRAKFAYGLIAWAFKKRMTHDKAWASEPIPLPPYYVLLSARKTETFFKSQAKVLKRRIIVGATQILSHSPTFSGYEAIRTASGKRPTSRSAILEAMEYLAIKSKNSVPTVKKRDLPPCKPVIHVVTALVAMLWALEDDLEQCRGANPIVELFFNEELLRHLLDEAERLLPHILKLKHIKLKESSMVRFVAD